MSIDKLINELYPKYSLKEILIKLENITSSHSFFGIEDENILYAKVRLEYLLDNYTFDDLRESGILLAEACTCK